MRRNAPQRFWQKPDGTCMEKPWAWTRWPLMVPSKPIFLKQNQSCFPCFNSFWRRNCTSNVDLGHQRFSRCLTHHIVKGRAWVLMFVNYFKNVSQEGTKTLHRWREQLSLSQKKKKICNFKRVKDKANLFEQPGSLLKLNITQLKQGTAEFCSICSIVARQQQAPILVTLFWYLWWCKEKGLFDIEKSQQTLIIHFLHRWCTNVQGSLDKRK